MNGKLLDVLELEPVLGKSAEAKSSFARNLQPSDDGLGLPAQSHDSMVKAVSVTKGILATQKSRNALLALARHRESRVCTVWS
jgi:hypothetical protein